MVNIVLTTKHPYNFHIIDIVENKLIYDSLRINFLENFDYMKENWKVFRPFGISINDYIYICSNNRISAFDKYNYSYSHNVELPLFKDTHQIQKVNNIFYTCNTGTDTIGIHNIHTKISKLFSVRTKKIVDEPHTNDECHVNSLCVQDNKIYYCLHNLARKNTQIFCLDLDTMICEEIIKYGLEGHSIKIVNNKLFFCSSSTNTLVEYDIISKQLIKYKFNDYKNIFLRGLDYYEGKLYIGGSINYRTDIKLKQSCILTFDLNTKKFNIMLMFENLSYIHDLKIF